MLYIFDSLKILSPLSFTFKIAFIISYLTYSIFCTTPMMLLAIAYLQLNALSRYICDYPKNQLKPLEVVMKASIIYDKLCDIFDSMSSFYLINNVFFLAGFYFFNFFFYYALYLYIKNPIKELLEFFISSIVFNLFFSPCVIWLVTFSSWVEREGKRAADLVQQLAKTGRCPKITKRSNILMQQVIHRKPNISCAFFTVNWKFFFQMLGNIFASAIILIQFYDAKIE